MHVPPPPPLVGVGWGGGDTLRRVLNWHFSFSAWYHKISYNPEFQVISPKRVARKYLCACMCVEHMLDEFIMLYYTLSYITIISGIWDYLFHVSGSLCTLYLHAQQVRLTVGNSGLYCRVTYCKCKLTPLFVDFISPNMVLIENVHIT